MGDDAQVIDNRAEERFELSVGCGTAIASYRREANTVVFTHTQVPQEMEGQGIASRLVAGALDQVRAAGLNIIPACSFVQAYVARHPETQDLLA